MAYVRNTTNDEVEEESSLINPSISGTSSGEMTANSQQTAGAASSNPNAQKAAGGGFTNLQKYLNANEGGAQQLGTRVAGDLNAARDTATTGLANATNAFATKVAAGTNIFNAELATNAANDASSYLTNTDLKRQLSEQYSGPSNFIGSDEDTAARKDLLAAQQRQAMTESEGGRTQILRDVLNVPGERQTSRGVLNLNQFLVQQNQPAWNTVKTAADNITPLTTQFTDNATNVQNSIKNARDTNLATKQSVLTRLAQGTTDLQGQINQQLAAKQIEADNQFALSNYASINDTGLTAPQIQAFNALNNETIAQGGTGVNFRDYLIAGTPKIYGTKDVATAPQVEDLDALATLQQVDNGFLQGGVAGSGASLDYMRAVSELLKQQNTIAGGGTGGTGTGGTGTTNPYGAGYTGPAAGTVGGTLGGTGRDGDGGPGNDRDTTGSGAGGSGLGSISINDQGIAVANTTGLSDQAASALGNILGAFLGIPGLGMIGSKINAGINSNANAAAAGANIAMQDSNANINGSMNTPGSAATSGPTGTGGIAANAGEAAAAAAAAAGMTDAAIGAAAQAAADAARGGASPAAAAAAGVAAADAAAISGGALHSGSSTADMDAHDADGLAAADAASASLDAAAPATGGGGGGGGDKIICTAMNDSYGLPYKENRIWVRYSRLHLKPEHQVGYHKIFLPLVKYAYHSGSGWTNTQIRKMLEWIAINRTSDIKNELAGAKRNPVHKFLRSIAEPILFWIGKGLK